MIYNLCLTAAMDTASVCATPIRPVRGLHSQYRSLQPVEIPALPPKQTKTFDGQQTDLTQADIEQLMAELAELKAANRLLRADQEALQLAYADRLMICGGPSGTARLSPIEEKEMAARQQRIAREATQFAALQARAIKDLRQLLALQQPLPAFPELQDQEYLARKKLEAEENEAWARLLDTNRQEMLPIQDLLYLQEREIQVNYTRELFRSLSKVYAQAVRADGDLKSSKLGEELTNDRGKQPIITPDDLSERRSGYAQIFSTARGLIEKIGAQLSAPNGVLADVANNGLDRLRHRRGQSLNAQIVEQINALRAVIAEIGGYKWEAAGQSYAFETRIEQLVRCSAQNTSCATSSVGSSGRGSPAMWLDLPTGTHSAACSPMPSPRAIPTMHISAPDGGTPCSEGGEFSPTTVRLDHIVIQPQPDKGATVLAVPACVPGGLPSPYTRTSMDFEPEGSPAREAMEKFWAPDRERVLPPMDGSQTSSRQSSQSGSMGPLIAEKPPKPADRSQVVSFVLPEQLSLLYEFGNTANRVVDLTGPGITITYPISAAKSSNPSQNTGGRLIEEQVQVVTRGGTKGSAAAAAPAVAGRGGQTKPTGRIVATPAPRPSMSVKPVVTATTLEINANPTGRKPVVSQSNASRVTPVHTSSAKPPLAPKPSTAPKAPKTSHLLATCDKWVKEQRNKKPAWQQ